jgi:hypothetical protein
MISRSETVVQCVRDFAKGLGCAVADESGAAGTGIQIQLPDTDDALLELLDFVALSAIRAGVGVKEPLCRLKYRREGSVQVALTLRCVELTLNS